MGTVMYTICIEKFEKGKISISEVMRDFNLLSGIKFFNNFKEEGKISGSYIFFRDEWEECDEVIKGITKLYPEIEFRIEKIDFETLKSYFVITAKGNYFYKELIL